MPVSKRNAPGIIVVGGRRIDPMVDLVRITDKKTVVHRARIFIDEDKSLRGAGRINHRLLRKNVERIGAAVTLD